MLSFSFIHFIHSAKGKQPSPAFSSILPTKLLLFPLFCFTHIWALKGKSRSGLVFLVLLVKKCQSVRRYILLSCSTIYIGTIMLLCAALVFYTLLLQLSTCNVKSHIELHLEYTSTILSILIQTACLVRYT